eukprot:tig00020616_g12271.t1
MASAAARRVDAIARQIAGVRSEEQQRPAGAEAGFPVEKMRTLLDAHNHDTRRRVYTLLASDPLFAYNYDMKLSEVREINWQRAQRLVRAGFFKGHLTSGGRDVQINLEHMATMECLAAYDHQLQVLCGVHLGLFGVSVMKLGTEKHRHLLQTVEDFQTIGCFGLTELGHGSNVRGIETEATYDKATGEFVINSPTETSQKYWIGAAAMRAHFSVVFANLAIGGENKGVHAFVVRIRNADGTVCPGIRIADCGHKMGLNGVDNGRIWLDHVRVPRDALLDRIAQVTEAGEYRSPLPSAEARFAALMLPLTGGRVGIAMNSVNVAKIALATAVRYSLTRRAFGPPGQPEVTLMEYQSHQARLMPLVAATYALNFACVDLKMKHARGAADTVKEVHVVSSGLKALATWHMSRAIQECREACGGQGYKSDNRFGALRADHDVALTFEGDNTVLLQQVAKALLAELKSSRGALEEAGRRVRGRLAAKPNVRCPEWQRAVFEARRLDLLMNLGLKYQQALEASKGEFWAWNKCLDVAGALGRAHTELVVLQRFDEALAAGGLDGALRAPLALARSLYALTRIDEEATFLRHQYVDRKTAEEVHAAQLALCADAAAIARPLVDAFGIPDFMLGAIAHDWVAHNSWDAVPPHLRQEGPRPAR